MKKKDLVNLMMLATTALSGCGGSGSSSSAPSVEVTRNLAFKALPSNTLYVQDSQSEERLVRDVNGVLTFNANITDDNNNQIIGSQNDINISYDVRDSDGQLLDTVNNLVAPLEVDVRNEGGNTFEITGIDTVTGERVATSIKVDKNDAPVLSNSTFENGVEFHGLTGDTFSIPSESDFNDAENDEITLNIAGNAVDYLENGVLKFTDAGTFYLEITSIDSFGARGDNSNQSYIITTPIIIQDSCAHGLEEILVGGALTTYPKNQVNHGENCDDIEQVSTCEIDSNNDAVLVPTPLQYSGCVVKDPENCTGPDGSTIPHGSSLEYFLTSSVPFGSSCSSESRICNDGTLSGSNTNTSCVVDACVPYTGPPSDSIIYGETATGPDGCGGTYSVDGTGSNEG